MLDNFDRTKTQHPELLPEIRSNSPINIFLLFWALIIVISCIIKFHVSLAFVTMTGQVLPEELGS